MNKMKIVVGILLSSIISITFQPLINAATVIDSNTQIEKLVSDSLKKKYFR